MSSAKGFKNWIIGLVVVLVLGAIAYGANKGATKETTPAETTASSTSSEKGSDGKELLTIKTWTRKDCSLTPWLVTDKLGYFKEEGVKLVFTGETQPAQEIPSILNGNNDVGDFHPNTIAVAKAGGAPIRGVIRAGLEPSADKDPVLRHMWWFVNPKSGIKSFADLKNKPGKLKFSTITTNICADFLGNLILDKYGIPRDKVEWVTMPDIQAVQALKQGLVDVAGVHPPFYKAMEDSGALKVADSSDANVGSAAGVSYYIFSDDFIKNNPEAVKRFARAITRGQQWANAHPKEAAKWTEEAIGVPVTATHYYAEQLGIVEDEITPWIKELEKGKVIPTGKITPSDIITHDFDK